MRKSSRKKGKEAEDIAAKYLLSRGFEIVERNFTIRGGEIDIIAREGDTLVFVEVKSSRIPLFDPIEQMTCRKISFLKRAAEIYLFRKGWLDRVNCRFDVITVKFKPDGEVEVKHLKNAFDY